MIHLIVLIVVTIAVIDLSLHLYRRWNWQDDNPPTLQYAPDDLIGKELR